jgi:predicted Kef-type K+ transport protein
MTYKTALKTLAVAVILFTGTGVIMAAIAQYPIICGVIVFFGMCLAVASQVVE